MSAKFDVKDENGQKVLEIEGPACMYQGPCCEQDLDFKVGHCFTPYNTWWGILCLLIQVFVLMFC